jgi:hypothetical protein
VLYVVAYLSDPLDLFVHEFPRTITAANGSEESSTITVTVEGFKAENGQQLNSTGAQPGPGQGVRESISFKMDSK